MRYKKHKLNYEVYYLLKKRKKENISFEGKNALKESL